MNRQIAGWITHRTAKWVVLVVALGVVFGFSSFASKLADVQDNDIASWLPGDAESTQFIERAEKLSNPDETPLVLLFTRDGGITEDDQAAIAEIGQKVYDIKEFADFGTEPVGPILSEDGEAAQVVATMLMDSDGWEDLPDVVDEARDIARDGAPEGLDVALAGPAAFGADQADAFGGIDGVLLFAALGVVIVMLLLTYRSPILWLIPLICGVLSIGAAQGVVYLLAKDGGLTVNGQSYAILSVLVLGAGIDYALLLVARYREELHHYEDRHEAMAHALHRAAPAILASGATVILGLLCLMFAEMNSTASLGPVAAVGIAAGLFVMLILLPVLLVICGRWVFWPFVPRFGTSARSDSGLWTRVGRAIARAPRKVWVVTTVLLAVAAVGTIQLDANGLTNEEQFTTSQPSVEAEEELLKHFPGGAGTPVQILTTTETADEVSRAVAETEGIDPQTVAPVDDQDGLTFIVATLSSAPDTDAAFDTIDRVRDAVHEVDGSDAVVGGLTAVNKDVQDASGNDNNLIIPIVLLVVFLILVGLLRSLLAPLILLGTVVLSFAAALGLSALVFKHIFDFGGADTSLPLFAFIFLVALGIDYNIFLMTRVREESLRHGTRRGALIGLSATGGVITSAGLVLAGTFAALATLPIVFLAELGFAVALGVLLDTIIVRSVLVTAITLDVGRHMWWPSALGRKEDEPADAPAPEAPEVAARA